MATTDSQPRRGRPPRISRDQIIAAALDIGLDSFSLQAIAERLGVTTPALYSHVRGREEIIELVAADLLERFQVTIDDTTDWRDWLMEFGRQARLLFGLSGQAARIDLAGLLAMRDLQVGEQGVRLLVKAGFSPSEAGMALWIVFRTATTAGQPNAGSLATPMDEARRVARTGDLPAIDQAIEDLKAVPDTLEFDLRVVIAGLENQLAQGPR